MRFVSWILRTVLKLVLRRSGGGSGYRSERPGGGLDLESLMDGRSHSYKKSSKYGRKKKSPMKRILDKLD